MKKIFKKKTLTKLITLSLIVISIGSAVACASNSDINTSSSTKNNKENELTVEQAKEIALKESNRGKVIGYERDVDFGEKAFEITILDGKTEKEYKIDMKSGKVLKVEAKDISIDPEEKLLINANPKNDIDKAESLVKAKYPNLTIKKFKLEVENGNLVYDVTVIKGNNEIEAKLDANSENFIEEEVDNQDD